MSIKRTKKLNFISPIAFLLIITLTTDNCNCDQGKDSHSIIQYGYISVMCEGREKKRHIKRDTFPL